MIKLHRGDCLEYMKQIPDRSIDMVLCDLPYGTTACKWDTVIPFEPLWREYNRIVKDNGAICLFGAEPFSSKLRISNIKAYKYDWVWRKPKGTGHLNTKKQPLRDVENISVFYNKQCVYNPQYAKGTPYAPKCGKTAKPNKTGVYGKFMNGIEYRNYNDGIRYPKQVIEFGVVERGTVHPTQKPVPLLEYLIKTYTNEGDLILDNCMGSGSTGVAAISLGRSFIGCEIDKEYYRIAKQRIQEARSQMYVCND